MKIYHIPAAPPLYTNTFLLVGENGLAAAVDPAAGAQEYLRLLEQEGARLTHILLTHGHYDHVGAVEELQRKTGAKVWLAPQDACGGELFPFTTPDNAYADGEEIECRACQCCGSGSVEGELYYMPGTDPISIAGAKDKIVLLDMAGVTHFVYQDLLKAGAKAILFQHGNMYYPHADIDQRDLREAVVGDGKKVLCATIHSGEAVRLVKTGVKQIRLEVQQKEYDGKSHNVIAELPGTCDEWIVLSAHYDTTSLSHGAYDNMSGCAGLLGILEQMKEQPRHYGLRFVFCGSEERGLLGSKAYVAAHAEELDKIVLNINLDMIGTYMGKFIACVSAEEKLSHYIT